MEIKGCSENSLNDWNWHQNFLNRYDTHIAKWDHDQDHIVTMEELKAARKNSKGDKDEIEWIDFTIKNFDKFSELTQDLPGKVQKVFEELPQGGDLNNDGTITKGEFAQAKASYKGDHLPLLEIIDKNFDTISMLHIDDKLTESGISKNDISMLDNPRWSKRDHSRREYEDYMAKVGGGLGFVAGAGLEIAAFVVDPVDTMATSVAMSKGLGAYGALRLTETGNPIAIAAGGASGAAAGFFWGPFTGGTLGYYTGGAIGSQFYFPRYVEPRIEKLSDDLCEPRHDF